MAAFLLLFPGIELYGRATIELNGVVVSSDTSCMQPWSNRCATKYVIEAADHSKALYIAGPSDDSLRRRLPVGTELVKEKWKFWYLVNGQRIDDFGLTGYLCLAGFGLALLRWHFMYERQNLVR